MQGNVLRSKVQLKLTLQAATVQIFSEKKCKNRNLLCKSCAVRVSKNAKKEFNTDGVEAHYRSSLKTKMSWKFMAA